MACPRVAALWLFGLLMLLGCEAKSHPAKQTSQEDDSRRVAADRTQSGLAEPVVQIGHAGRLEHVVFSPGEGRC